MIWVLPSLSENLVLCFPFQTLCISDTWIQTLCTSDTWVWAELYQSDMKEDLKFQFKSKGYGDKRISWNHLCHSRTEEYATFRVKSVEGVPGSRTRCQLNWEVAAVMFLLNNVLWIVIAPCWDMGRNWRETQKYLWQLDMSTICKGLIN